MTGPYSKLKRSIWSDPDIMSLSADATYVYIYALSGPKLTMLGSQEFSERRWVTATKLPADRLMAALDELVESRHLLIDWNTDEVIVRTFVAHSVTLNNSKTAKGIWNEWERLASASCRAAILPDLPEMMWDTAPESAIRLRTGSEPKENRTGTEPEPDQNLNHQSSSSRQHPSSSCETPLSGDLTETELGLVEAVLGAMADRTMAQVRQRGDTIDAPGRYRAKVIRNDRLEHGQKIAEVVRRYPTAPLDMIASKAQGEPCPYIGQYASDAA